MLTRLGYEADVVANGLEAVQAVALQRAIQFLAVAEEPNGGPSGLGFQQWGLCAS